MTMDQSERAVALIVEDDPWTRLLIGDVLCQAGYAVQEASNGCAALRLAEREHPVLVLLDLVLPERSGLSVLAELKTAPATAHVPVIVVSGQTDLLGRAAGLADAVVTKPFDVDELLAKVSRAERHLLSRGDNPCRTIIPVPTLGFRMGNGQASVATTGRYQRAGPSDSSSRYLAV
jgi:DNA-binding response OmpR family regulator